LNAPCVRAEYHGLIRSEIFPLLPATIGRLLDVGGGTGATASAIKAERHVAFAGVIDQVAGQPAPGIELDFREAVDLGAVASLARIGERHGPFDCILCLDILEHLVDPWAVVKALHQVLAPGGVIVASIPNVQHHSVVCALMTGDWRYDPKGGLLDATHLRFFTKRTAIQLMTSSGLKLDRVGDTGLGPGSKSGLIDRVSFGVLRGFLAYQYLIRVKRS